MLNRSTKPQLSWGQLAIKETIWDAVESVGRHYAFDQHPYFRWAETTAQAEFLATQVPFRFAVESFSQALAGVLARMPRIEGRVHLAENIAEEHGHGNLRVSHKYTFLEYLRALGATDESLSEPCPIWVTAFNHSLRNLCLAQQYEVGAAALGIIEHLYVGISARLAKLLNDKNWVKPGAQSHYLVHEDLDVEHARELLLIAEPAWTSPRSRSYVALGLLLGAYHLWTLYDDLLIPVQDWQAHRE
ncbi:MAG: hypothetical protein HN750_08155 [Gemmatimonadales bacterium]|nr:hypothetical protein [Gemmatimonadales bacterium]